MPDYVINALQYNRSQADAERMQDAQLKSWLYDLTQRQKQDETARTAHAALLKALDPNAQGASTMPATAPPVGPQNAPDGGAQTFPLPAPPSIQGTPLPTPTPGQPSTPMQAPGGAGMPPAASLLGPKGQAYLAAQPPNAQPAALKVLLASLMGKPATATAGPPPTSPAVPAAAAAQAGPQAGPGAPPPGWTPSPAASPALGGAPPQPQAPGASPGLGMPPIGAPGGIEPSKLPSIPQLIDRMNKAGVDPEAQFQALQTYSKIEDAESKKAIQEARIAAEIYRAGYDAMRAAAAKARAEQGPKPTAFEQEAADLYGKGTPEYRKALTEKVKRDSAPTSAMVSGAPGSTGLSPGAVDLAASQYLATGQMPPLGFSSQALRTAILNRAAELGQQTGENPSTVPGKRAEFKANQTALTQVTKDLTAIAPYQQMLEKNADIAIDLAGKVAKMNTPLANKSINWLEQNAAGDPDTAEYLAQIRIVQTEAARVLNNPRLVGQLTDSARHEMEGIVNGNMTLAQTKSVLGRLKQDGQNRVNAMEDQSKRLRAALGSGGSAPSTPGAPAVGTVKQGYRFKGGDPSKQENWEKVK